MVSNFPTMSILKDAKKNCILQMGLHIDETVFFRELLLINQQLFKR